MKICPGCGQANDDAAKFCSGCATPLPDAPNDAARGVPAPPQTAYYAQPPVPRQAPAAVGNAPDAQKPKKSKKKKWIVIAAVALVFIIIIAGSGKKGDKTAPGSTTVSRNASTTAAKTAEPTTAARGLSVGASATFDGVKITYESCEPDFKNYSRYATVTDGHKVISAGFRFENISDRDQMLSSFQCYADNALCDSFYYVDDYKDPVLETIGPGRTFDAVIFFEVPEDAVEIDLEYGSSLYGGDKLFFIVQ